MINKLCFFAGNTGRIIRKHIFLTMLMILLINMSFILICISFNQNSKIKDNAEQFNKTYGNKTYYFMGDAIGDTDYLKYIDDDNVEDYKSLYSFLQRLYKEESFDVISLNSQQFEYINTKIPDIFLYGYEEGYADLQGCEIDGRVYYAAKSIQVSDKFFSEFDINVSEGRGFSEEDYTSSGDTVPVLMGSAYKDVFSLGDKFTAAYLLNESTFEVIGFVDENSFFYDDNDTTLISCERYVILPTIYSETDTPTKINKISLLANANGLIISSEGNTAVAETFKNIMKECGLSEHFLYITSTYDREVSSMNYFAKTYSSMTAEVSAHFKTILILIVIFTVFSLAVSICGFIREQHYNYGVNMLCGSSYFDISINIVMLTGFIILTGTVLAVFIISLTSYYSLEGLLTVCLISLGIWIFVTLVTLIYLKSMKLQDIVGGKE